VLDSPSEVVPLENKSSKYYEVEEAYYEPILLKPLRLEVSSHASIADYEFSLQEILPHVKFIGCIELDEVHLEELITLLSIELEEAHNTSRQAKDLAKVYPCAVAYVLVHLAADEYKDGEVWPLIAERLGHDKQVVYELRESIRICQECYDLAICQAQRQNLFVSQLLFHAGIPNCYMNQFINLVYCNFVQYGLVTPRAVLERHRARLRDPYWRESQWKIPEPIIDFLEYGGSWAAQWVIITAEWLGAPSGLSLERQEVAPSRLLNALERAGHREVSVGSSPVLTDRKRRSRQRASSMRHETWLDIEKNALILRIKEQEFLGDFDRQAWLYALLKDKDGTTVDRVILDASRIHDGIRVQPAELTLPEVGGPFQLEIDYGGDVLASSLVQSLDNCELCAVFSLSGRPINRDLLRYPHVLMLVAQGAQVLPETTIRSEKEFSVEAGFHLLTLDLRECENLELQVRLGTALMTYRVKAELLDEEIDLHEGQRVHGAYSRGCPIYAGELPQLRFLTEERDEGPRPVFNQLCLVVDMLTENRRVEWDMTELLEMVTQDDRWTNLNLLMDLMDTSLESPFKITFSWVDALGLDRELTLINLPGFLLDYAASVFLPEENAVAPVDVIVPSGWQLTVNRGATVIGAYEDVVELGLDLSRLIIYGELSYQNTALPISIELPIVQWNFRGTLDRKRWTTSPESIWIDQIEDDEYECLAVMITSSFIGRIVLKVGSTEVFTRSVDAGELVYDFDLSNLPELVRQHGPSLPLYVMLYDHDLTPAVPPIQVATLYAKWVPQELSATLVDNRQLVLSWVGLAPHSRMLVTLQPAWNDAKRSYGSTIEAGANQCVLEDEGIQPGPYYLSLMEESEALWHPSDRGSLIYVSDGRYQIRGFEVHREGNRLTGTVVVSPEGLLSVKGVVLRDGIRPHLEEFNLSRNERGQFEFAIDNCNGDVSIVGVYSLDYEVYRFITVGRSLASAKSISRAEAAYWYDLLNTLDQGWRLWITREIGQPISVTPKKSKEILKTLAAPQEKQETFPLDVPELAGVVKLEVNPHDDQEFDLVFKERLGKCANPNCPHPRQVIEQSVWHEIHYPKCKSFENCRGHLRVRLIMEYDLDELIEATTHQSEGTADYLTIIADSSFRPLPICDQELKDATRLGGVLIGAYQDLVHHLISNIRAGKVCEQ